MKIIKPRKGSNGKQNYHFPICSGRDADGVNCFKSRSYIPLDGGVVIKSCSCGSSGILLTLKAMEHMRKAVREAVAAWGKGV